ncbi:hypothetical protein EMPS_00391 [Entomortierella parvispora]|uniref:Tail specific protease domain-containing protein n=1 Tax=Entomortierella parvispora TaxID=205924 RepID=A0A9P3H0Z6_9FUNG|nr:hypothetical protein EMPS_00391 [Entomortierella parvispora]
MLPPSLQQTILLGGILLAPIAVAVPSTPSPLDACGSLASKNISSITVADVSNCYRAIPFNSTQAKTTLETVYTLFKDYYVFTDLALNPRVPKPFKNEPVDVLGRLETIGRTKYSSDFQFHTDIRATIEALKDGHASCDVNCYASYNFVNRLALHAPVVNGTQQLRVFRDIHDDEYKGCIVETIDGQPSWPYMKWWSTNVLGYSHDPNARLNLALATQMYKPDMGRFDTFDGLFAARTVPPANNTIEYQLRCDGASKPIQISGEWIVQPVNDKVNFDSIESFVKNVCLAPNDEESAHGPTPAPVPIPNPSPAGPLPGISVQEFPGAEKILEGNGTVFYHLKEQPHIGVMVIHTFDIAPVEIEGEVVFQGLTALNSRNVTNLVIDFQSNIGGYVELSAIVVQLLFPNKSPFDVLLQADQRVAKPLQQAALHGYRANTTEYMDASLLVDLKTGLPYKDNSIFSRPVTLTRNGRQNLYTERTALLVPTIPQSQVDVIKTFPWTDNADNIRVITDGRSGSATGMTTYLLTNEHNVEAFVVGGTAGEDMSMFSFAGASVLALSDIQQTYKGLGAVSPMRDIPYSSTIRFSWLEVYARDSSIPLEYDAVRFRTKNHLNYSIETSFDRSAMWKQVAALSWKR